MKATNFPGTIEVYDDASDSQALADLVERAPVSLCPNTETKGVVNLWNWAHGNAGGFDYLIISNNDVVFTEDWWKPLIQAFEAEDCGISGPMTNQPGHQEHQLVPIQSPILFLRHAAQRAKNGNAFQLQFINGFCFCVKMDRVVMFDEKHMFNPKMENYGGEDEYQERMRASGKKAFMMQDSLVYHWKDCSFESWRVGRMGLSLDTLPPRLPEDTDFDQEHEEKILDKG